MPPFKLAALQKEMAKMDRNSKEYQRLKWEQLRKGINGLINKVGALGAGTGGGLRRASLTALLPRTRPRTRTPGASVCLPPPPPLPS